MGDELTYVLITPYSLHKSRTGGIIARLLSLCPLEFVAARMYAFSDSFVDAYRQTLALEDMPEEIRRGLDQYVNDILRRRNRFGISNRAMLLLFRGPDAVRALRDEAVGPISPDVKGDTVRGTYGDVAMAGPGEFEFFEPAVLAPTTHAANDAQLRLLARFAESDGGVLTHVLKFPPGANVETTLVIIKPDNFARRSSRPGNIIDVFSRTGLFIVGARVLQMSTAMAEEFYRPLRAAFVERLKGNLAERLRHAVQQTIRLNPTDEQAAALAEVLKEAYAEQEFRKIVNYMSGEGGELESPGWARKRAPCMALLYQGVNAIQKIRDRLGATNPQEAREGTVRSSYGHDLMRNGAHASDSPENAERERRILGLWEEEGKSDVHMLIEEYLGETIPSEPKTVVSRRA